MEMNCVYLYLISPLHTGSTTQEGNLLGIARESHTNLPYIPSSTIRGRLRSNVDELIKRVKLFGPELKDTQNTEFVEKYEKATGKKITQLEQGDIWVGDASLLWFPVPSLSHGVIWISCPMLLQRWIRFNETADNFPPEYSTSLNKSTVYLKDAILKSDTLKEWEEWKNFIPQSPETKNIKPVIVLPNQHCATLIQMSLWRQVKVNLDEHKSVKDGSFRYEEAISPDTLMYFSWGITSQANGTATQSSNDFKQLLNAHNILQIGGQESLGRGFVQQWVSTTSK